MRKDAIEFIDGNGGGAGLRLQKTASEKNLIERGINSEAAGGSCLGPREKLIDQLIVFSIKRINKCDVLQHEPILKIFGEHVPGARHAVPRPNIDENGGGAGVRLRRRQQKKS